MVGYGLRADEGDMSDARVRGKVVRDVGPADDRLDDVGGVTASYEGGGSN